MRKILLAITIAFLLLTACARGEPSPAATSEQISPSSASLSSTKSAATPAKSINKWPISTPAQEGMDGEKIDAMLADIQGKAIPIHSILILRHGKIVSEYYLSPYDADTRHHLFSVTKSFISAVAGIAYGQGKLDIEQDVLSLFPDHTFANIDAAKQSLKIKHLLTMTTGLGWEEGNTSYSQLVRSSDWVQMMLDLPMTSQPGEEFNYCSGCSYLLSAAIQQSTGVNTLEFARQYFFEPLEIVNYEWETDPQGTPNGGWGLYLTPRDMAKLGYLYLHKGNWNGQQIIPEDWVTASTTTQKETSGNESYGYQWWITRNQNAYMASGKDGQTIFVVPQFDLIVVTTASMSDGHDTIFQLINRFVLPAIND